MTHATQVPMSKLVQEQMAHPSPIRQIMKMAERQNILAMGLEPEDVISFGGGWVNHAAPEGLRQAFAEIVRAEIGEAGRFPCRRKHGFFREINWVGFHFRNRLTMGIAQLRGTQVVD